MKILYHTYISQVARNDEFLEQILIGIHIWIRLVAIKPIAAMAFVSMLPKGTLPGNGT